MYALSSVHTLAHYLHSIKPNISPIKLQKSLYFLYAYYGGMKKKLVDEDGVSEGTNDPDEKELFKAKFEAWTYGPVIRDVYTNGKYSNIGGYGEKNPKAFKEAIQEIESLPEVKIFIDDLFSQIDEVSDFSLVERSHQDKSWIEPFDSGNEEMDNNEIVEEYAERYMK